MVRKTIISILGLMPSLLMAQSFCFDLTKQQPVYSVDQGFGYDILPAPEKTKPSEPFYFSVKVPDGNYHVKVTLGGKKNGNTTVRAEGRRLMMDNILTPKIKDEQIVEFVINKRSPQIDYKSRVKIKEREKDYLSWDEKLTLEFNGPMPAVKSILIERSDNVPTIYLCGNSTVVDQNNEPWASWGQMITRWFGPEVAISNHAESGLTARTFLASFRLEKILSTLKKGDYVIVEFGHNDEKEHNPGDGAWYHYVYQLKIFVDLVRAKGAELIFCTPTQRRIFEDNHKAIRNTHGDFPEAMKSVANRENIPLIDLNIMTKTLFESLGYENSKRALVHYPKEMYGQELADNTHFNPYGAYEVAKCVVMGMKQLELPIVQYLRNDWHDFDPAHPDSWDSFLWAPAKNADIVKPDGN